MLATTVLLMTAAAAHAGSFRAAAVRNDPTRKLANTINTNSVILLRLGNGIGAVPTNSVLQPYFDEYTVSTTSATLVQSIPASQPGNPDSDSTAANIPSPSATDAHGQLELSADGQNVLVAGYNVSAGSTTYTATTVRRVVAQMSLAGDVSYTSFTMPGTYSTGQVWAVASDDSQRYWVVGSGGSSYLPASLVNGAAATNIYGNSFYRSLAVYSGRLYISRSSNNEVHVYNTALPTTTQGSHTAMGTSTFSDARGQVWRSPLEFWIVDQGVGLYRMSRPSATSTTWTRTNVYRAGGGTPVSAFLDVTLHADNVTLYVVTASALYGFDANALTWLNSGQPLLSAATNTVFRGVCRAPLPPPTPTATASASAAPTTSAQSTASATQSAAPTASATASATATASGSHSRAPVDLEKLARDAASKASEQSKTTTVVIGAALGGMVVAMGLGFIGMQYRHRKVTEARLRKLQATQRGSSSSRGMYFGGEEPTKPGFQHVASVGTTSDVIMYQVAMPARAAPAPAPVHIASADTMRLFSKGHKTGHEPLRSSR